MSIEKILEELSNMTTKNGRARYVSLEMSLDYHPHLAPGQRFARTWQGYHEDAGHTEKYSTSKEILVALRERIRFTRDELPKRIQAALNNHAKQTNIGTDTDTET